ncbi:tRNA (N6-isopentenyl adenosine(37)-C2)-methylthiotransferase MiaB [Chloroflexota bacterium]
MPKYYLWTIGCQMNKAESERLGSYLEQHDYEETDSAENADLIVLNSCVVRQSAENRVINKLHITKKLKAARPKTVVAVTGCIVNNDVAPLRKRFPHVDYFFKAGGSLPLWEEPAATAYLPRKTGPSAFVPIIQGCDNFCSYCIVPYRRGREKSRPLSEIACEVTELVTGRAKEVTLLGQNVDSYGHDLPDKPDLADLLQELNRIEGLARIRFLTNHPKDISPRLIAAMASLDKICEQISLPVQSGSDAVLQAMDRGYTVGQYRQIIAQLRNNLPNIALSTDVILGFPSETESQFRETADLLAELKFDKVHVAVYSPRPGTKAAREMEDNVPPGEKKRRLDIVEEMQEKIAAEINHELQGKIMEVLVEGSHKGKWWGRTRTDKLVFLSDITDLTGELVNVKITGTSPWSLQGTPVR